LALLSCGKKTELAVPTVEQTHDSALIATVCPNNKHVLKAACSWIPDLVCTLSVAVGFTEGFLDTGVL